MSGKRLFDIVFSAAALVVLSPVMLLIALLVKICSPGPVFFKADRAGMDLSRFTMYKFRSMVVNNDTVAQITMRDDARIYPFGRFLRKTKLDELPQLFNILLGDMSVVGPRPEDFMLAVRYYNGPYRKLASVKPGLTSPASLFDYTHGENASSVDAYVDIYLMEKLNMDLHYIERRSFLYDLKIILKTAWIICCIAVGRKHFRYPVEYRAHAS